MALTSKFKNVLLVAKTPRLIRMQKKGLTMNPYVEKIYKHGLNQNYKEHCGILDEFTKCLTNMDKKVTVVYEDEVTDEHYQKAQPDVVLSVGGQRTFLQASRVIPGPQTPIFGIKTLSSSVASQNMLHNEVDFKRRAKQIPILLEAMDDTSLTSTYKRTRALFESTHEARKSKMSSKDLDLCEKMLVLNEVFTGEKDVGTASRFRIRADENELGVFKSSGLIISTGTGSTGWLYSSRQMTPSKIDAIASLMGYGDINSVINAEIAKKLSEESKFAIDKNELYYYVREGFSTTKIGEGYATEVKVISEMLNGEAVVDGQKVFDLSIGDQFYVTAHPKYALNCLMIDL